MSDERSQKDCTVDGSVLFWWSLLAGAVAVGMFELFEMAWGRWPLTDLSLHPGGWWGAAGVLLIGGMAHEVIHGIAWVLAGRVGWNAVSFRPHWKALGIMAHLNTTVSAQAYRISGLLPAVVLGVVPLSAGFAIGDGRILFWGAFFLATAIGDLAAVWALRHVSPAAAVSDHPTRLGCVVSAV